MILERPSLGDIRVTVHPDSDFHTELEGKTGRIIEDLTSTPGTQLHLYRVDVDVDGQSRQVSLYEDEMEGLPFGLTRVGYLKDNGFLDPFER